MGILLRVLVIFILILSIAALWFGALLFGKRELLKGRTQRLESHVIVLGTVIENEAPTMPAKPEFVERDISPLNPQPIETPERTNYWATYQYELELPDQPAAVMDLKKKENELMTYYKMGPDGKPEQDPITRLYITKGEGTMDFVLNDMMTRAEAQLKRLNDTRKQLKLIRQELNGTIDELNALKKEHRVRLKEIVDLKAEIEKLNAKIAELNKEIEALKQDIEAKKAIIAERDATIVKKDEKIADLEMKNKNQKAIIDRLLKEKLGDVQAEIWSIRVKSGPKGAVAETNNDWNYVVIDFTEAFLKELLGPDLSEPFVPGDLLIKRGSEDGPIVTKVNLVHMNKEKKLGIGNVLPGWTQMPIKKGDIVVFVAHQP